MEKHPVHTEFGGRLVILGFGCIGRGVLPLLLRHIAIRPDQIRIITEHDSHRAIADTYRVALRAQAITRDNCHAVLHEELGRRT